MRRAARRQSRAQLSKRNPRCAPALVSPRPGRRDASDDRALHASDLGLTSARRRPPVVAPRREARMRAHASTLAASRGVYHRDGACRVCARTSARVLHNRRALAPSAAMRIRKSGWPVRGFGTPVNRFSVSGRGATSEPPAGRFGRYPVSAARSSVRAECSSQSAPAGGTRPGRLQASLAGVTPRRGEFGGDSLTFGPWRASIPIRIVTRSSLK